MNNTDIPFVFWGTPDFAATILDQLKTAELLPSLVVTAPDKPAGRGQKITAPAVKQWADDNNIPTLQPAVIDASLKQKLLDAAPDAGWAVFVVVAYGHILPKEIISLPQHNTLNVHPSLLPKLRGPAPIREAILQENKTGVSIIELDKKMDHGPIVAQEVVSTDTWPPTYDELKNLLGTLSGKLLAEILPRWVSGNITARSQDHDQATYSRKFSSDDGLINLNDAPEQNLRKIRAFTQWPKAHFYTEDTRIIITEAHLEKGELVIDRVKPAGMQEMSYEEFKTNKH